MTNDPRSLFGRLSRRRAVSGGLACALVLAALPAAAQSAYPSRPIRFIVPYAAGGTTDLVARRVGARMAETLGQPIVVENRGGAGGNIGMDVVAKSQPDGYTIGMGAISTNALNPHLYKSMPFDPRKDFTAISLLGSSTIVLEVGPQVPVKSVAELIAYAKKNPGLAYATAGAGTSMNLAGVLFAQSVGIELTHIPYKGSVAGITDVLGGQVPIMFDNLPASLAQIQAGKLRALAVAGTQRSASLPDTPTMAEAGLAGYSVEPWFGVYGPANLPAAIVQKLNQAIVDAIGSNAVQETLMAAGFTPRGSSAATLDTLSRQDYERFGKIAASAHMTID